MALTESQNTERLSRVPFAFNLVLCVVLIPQIGVAGAAVATATALIVESLLLFWATKRRLGFHVLIWGRP